MRRLGVCGATESLLIDKKIAKKILPEIAQDLIEAGCEMRGDEQAIEIDSRIKLAEEKDFYTEYLDKIISIKIVKDIDEAIKHIGIYGYTTATLLEITTLKPSALELAESLVILCHRALALEHVDLHAGLHVVGRPMNAEQRVDLLLAIAEAAHPVAEADRPTGHTGPLEPFTTILDDTDQPLREWAVDFDSPDDTNVWIRRDDTLQEGRVVIGEPTVNVELECAGTLQFSPDDADHLAGAIRAAARAVRAQVQESVTKENVVTRALRGSAALGDYLTLTAVLAHDDHLTLIVDDEFSRSTHRVGFDDALEASRLFSEMARIGRPSSMRANLRFVELDATDIS